MATSPRRQHRQPLGGVVVAVYGAVWPARNGTKDKAVQRIEALGGSVTSNLTAATVIVATAASAKALRAGGAWSKRGAVVVGW